MIRAFNAQEADFSGMTGRPPSAAPFAIGQIVHRAVIDVMEDGTEAAAATAVTVFGPHAAAATGGVSRRPSVPVRPPLMPPAPSASRAGSSIRGKPRAEDGRCRTETARIAASSDIRFSSSVVRRLSSLVRHSSPVLCPLSSARCDIGDQADEARHVQKRHARFGVALGARGLRRDSARKAELGRLLQPGSGLRHRPHRARKRHLAEIDRIGGERRMASEETSAAAAARSAAGSWMRRPPATLR